DGLVVPLLSRPDLGETSQGPVVARKRSQGVAVPRFGQVQTADGEMLGPQLPLGPGEALARLASGATGLDGPSQLRGRAFRGAVEARQPRPARQRVEARIETRHRVERPRRRLVLAQRPPRIAPDPASLAATRNRLDRPAA